MMIESHYGQKKILQFWSKSLLSLSLSEDSDLLLHNKMKMKIVPEILYSCRNVFSDTVLRCDFSLSLFSLFSLSLQKFDWRNRRPICDLIIIIKTENRERAKIVFLCCFLLLLLLRKNLRVRETNDNLQKSVSKHDVHSNFFFWQNPRYRTFSKSQN